MSEECKLYSLYQVVEESDGGGVVGACHSKIYVIQFNVIQNQTCIILNEEKQPNKQIVQNTKNCFLRAFQLLR